MATSAIGEGQLPLMDKNGNLERTPLFDPSSHPIVVASVARKYQALQRALTHMRHRLVMTISQNECPKQLSHPRWLQHNAKTFGLLAPSLAESISLAWVGDWRATPTCKSDERKIRSCVRIIMRSMVCLREHV